ncbi:MAG: peptidylprolyl isomerase [Chloroflexi bacterium]|nr:peptidylprolyl isomerase [Chloroflexota bacterium]|tara:strand:+ start:581 stop:1027 length:447 start_codon:yes stop_codon:yes gene_type:complete
MQRFSVIVMVLFSVAILGIACGPEEEVTGKEVTMPEQITTSSGLQYTDIAIGDGDTVASGMTVVVHYTGWLLDGSKFDSSVDRGTPFEFPLGAGRVIRGWEEGVVGMNIGGKRELIIPPDLGYGASGAGGVIPPNATLKFEVELLGLK